MSRIMTSPRWRNALLLLIVYLGFISLGIPDNILGIAWEPMHHEFGQPLAYAGFVTILLTVCSAVSAFLSGAILRRFGTGKLLMFCGFLTSAGLLGYALAPYFGVFLVFSLLLGFGQGAVDTGMNYYVAEHYSSRHMSWLHCCWGIGATLGPWLITTILVHPGVSWRWGYFLLFGIQLALALLFLSTLRLWQTPDSLPDATSKGSSMPLTTSSIADKSHVCYSWRFFSCPVMFMLYCGAEASMGLWGFQFLTRCHNFSLEAAGFSVALYWGMLTAGRFLIGIFANRLGNFLQIRLSLIGGCIGAGLLCIPWAPCALVGLALLGFAFAPFYPAMMHAAPERFDSATAAAVIGYQGGAGMLGGAGLPAALGLFAEYTTFAVLPLFGITTCVALLYLQVKVDGWHRPTHAHATSR